MLPASRAEPAASCSASPRAATPGRPPVPSSLSPQPVILASRQCGCSRDSGPLGSSGITHSVKPTLALPRGQWRKGVGLWKGGRKGTVQGETPTPSGTVIQQGVCPAGGRGRRGVSAVLPRSRKHLALQSRMCGSGRSRAEGEGQVVDLNKHPNPLQFPYVEIEVSSPALVEEKEAQTPKSFDLCCHISSSDRMRIEGIRKPLTFPHSARFPLQLYPRW